LRACKPTVGMHRMGMHPYGEWGFEITLPPVPLAAELLVGAVRW